jgi:hypothetical protein
MVDAGPGLRTIFLSVVFLSGCATLFREVKKDLILVNAALSGDDVEMTLQDSFITTYKDRATIKLSLTVEKANKKPHPAFWDGDFHLAGRSAAIGLPVVAEIANAASEEDAIERIHLAQSTGKPIRVAGAWRLWSEHVGKAEEYQGTELAPLEDTNPGHVFELHPLTLIENRDLRGSFRPVAGYRPEKAETVFKSLEKIPCRIVSKSTTTTIVTRKRQFNDVEFLLELTAGRQVVVEDGRFVDAAALDLGGNRLVDKLRMVFVKDTPPDRLVRKLKAGDRLHVIGLPRVDLAAVARRVRQAVENPELLNRNLPYEIVVVGAYPNNSGLPDSRTAYVLGRPDPESRHVPFRDFQKRLRPVGPVVDSGLEARGRADAVAVQETRVLRRNVVEVVLVLCPGQEKDLERDIPALPGLQDSPNVVLGERIVRCGVSEDAVELAAREKKDFRHLVPTDRDDRAGKGGDRSVLLGMAQRNLDRSIAAHRDPRDSAILSARQHAVAAFDLLRQVLRD